MKKNKNDKLTTKSKLDKRAELRNIKKNLKDIKKIKNGLDKLEENAEEIKNKLDRSLEMLKRMQVDEKLNDLEKELEELGHVCCLNIILKI